MEPILKGSGSIWVLHKEKRIHVVYHIYNKHTEAFASYTYWKKESIEGFGDHPDTKEAIIEAVDNLLDEMDEAGMDVWTTTHPSSDQKVNIVMFKPI